MVKWKIKVICEWIIDGEFNKPYINRTLRSNLK